MNKPLEALKLRKAINRTSLSKLDKMLAAEVNGLVRGTTQFGAAQRTQRYGGRLIQTQNFARPKLKHPELYTHLIESLNPKLIQMLHGDVYRFLVDNLRCMITAPEGKMFVVTDLKSIEAVVGGYATGCENINKIFWNGKDTYTDYATDVYNIPYDEVTKEQRFFCKPAFLGCEYQLGAKGLVEYAAGMGVDMTLEEAKRLVKLYRARYPEIKNAWTWLKDNIQAVIKGDINYAEGCGVQITRDQHFLKIELPSGRCIHYHQPLVLMKEPPWKKEKENYKEDKWNELCWELNLDPDTTNELPADPIPTITYMGMNQYAKGGKKWERIKTHGGKVFENIVQAWARDVLAYQLWFVEMDDLLDLIFHVHDEPISMADEDKAEEALQHQIDIHSIRPPWCSNMFLKGEGFITKRYTKD